MDRLAVKRILFGAVGACALALVGCPSPFLARIKQEVAAAPYSGTSYTFLRQFGNDHPEWSFNNPIVKTDTAGFIYVADNSFRIRKYNAAGVLQTTVGGVSTQGVNARIYDMAFDAAGNMYVTTNDTKKVQKYDVNGSLVKSWGSSTDLYGAASMALGTAYGIAVDSSGNVYVVDETYGQYRVLKFSSTGGYLAEWGNTTTYGGASSWGGASTSPSLAFNSPTSIAIDSSGNIYVLDSGNNRVVKFDSSGNYLTDWGAAATDVYPYTTGSTMSYPESISVGIGGYSTYVFVVDSSNSRVLKFGNTGYYSTEWGDTSVFSSPNSVAIDTAGYAYVSDQGGGSFMDRVQKFNISSTPTLSASWTTAAAADGLTVTPWGVAFDPAGNIVVSELFSQRLEYFTPTGTFSRKVTLTGSAAAGIAVSAAGNVYVAEFSANHYQVVNTSGVVIATVGSTGAGDGQLSSPIALAVDASENVYVADNGNARVQIFSSSGYYQGKFGTAGTLDGQFTAGALYGIAVDSVNKWVYVSDYEENRVQKFGFDGTYIMTVGTAGTGDGQFYAPIGMAVDPNGNLYVCDMANHRVEKFDSAGTFVTKFGTAGAGNGGFGWPVGVAVGPSGDIVVTDYTGSLVQVFSPTF